MTDQDQQKRPDAGDEDKGHLLPVDAWNRVVAEREAYLASIGETDEQSPLHRTPES